MSVLGAGTWGLGIPTPFHDTYRLGYLASLDPYHPRRDLGTEIPPPPRRDLGPEIPTPKKGLGPEISNPTPRTDMCLWKHTFSQLSFRVLIIKIKTTLPPANSKDVNAIEVKLGHWRRENATDWKILYNISENPSTSCHSVSICQRIDIFNSFHGTKSIRPFFAKREVDSIISSHKWITCPFRSVCLSMFSYFLL